MKDLIKFLFIFCGFAPGAFAYVPQQGNISALLGPFIYKTDFHGSATVPGAPVIPGGCLMAIGDISEHGSLEIAVYYMNKIYYRQSEGNYVSANTQVMHVSMGYRRWLGEQTSLSLAVFSTYPLGDIDSVYNDPGAPPVTSANLNVVYGAEAGLEQELWSDGRWAAVADLRYSKEYPGYSGEYGNHYGVLLAARYFIQGKDKKK